MFERELHLVEQQITSSNYSTCMFFHGRIFGCPKLQGVPHCFRSLELLKACSAWRGKVTWKKNHERRGHHARYQKRRQQRENEEHLGSVFCGVPLRGHLQFGRSWGLIA